MFEEYSEKNRSELPPLTIIQGGGTIRRDESDRALQYDKGSLSNYKMVNKGDFIVHLRSFEGGLEKANSTGIVSPAYHTISGENTDTTFYYAYFRSKKFIESDLKPHVYGIRDGRSIDIEGMKTINIPYTIFDEQRRIGKFIDLIDHLITLHHRKSFAHIFKDIDNSTLYWEQRKTSELFKVTRGYVLAANITAANKSGDNPYPVYSSQTKDNGLMGYYKDYLYENAITWTTDGANAGTVNYRGEKFYCTNVCGVLLGDKVTPNQMLAEAINNVAKGHVSYVGNPKLMNNVMAEICIWLPSEDTERKAISTFVYSIDHLITLHQLEPFQLIFKAIAYRIIDYAKSKPPRCIK